MSTAKEVFSKQAEGLVSERNVKLTKLAIHLTGLKDIQHRVEESGVDPITAIALDQQYRTGSEKLVKKKRELTQFPQQLQELLSIYQLDTIEISTPSDKPSVSGETINLITDIVATVIEEIEPKGIIVDKPVGIVESEEGGVIPWFIDPETGRVFPRPEIIEPGRRPVTDLSRKQEGVAYARLVINSDRSGFVYRTLEAMTADVYEDVINTATNDTERLKKLRSNTGAALQVIERITEKVGQPNLDLNTAPHLARLLRWARTFPEYALIPSDKFTHTLAQVIDRAITFEQLLQLQQATVLSNEASEFRTDEHEPVDFSMHPAEVFFLTSLVQNDKAIAAVRARMGLGEDTVSVLPPGDIEQLNKIIARLGEQDLTGLTDSSEEFISGIRQKLITYKANKAAVVAALADTDQDLLFILSFFPTEQEVAVEDLFSLMAAAVLSEAVKKNDTLGRAEPEGALATNSARSTTEAQGTFRRIDIQAVLNKEGPIPDFEWIGQTNLASRGFDISYQDGIPTLSFPTLQSMKDAAYAFLYLRYSKTGQVLEGRAKVEQYFIQDMPTLAELLVRGRHAESGQIPPNLDRFIGHIQRMRIFTNMPDDVFVDVLYREESGLQALRDQGVVIGSPQNQDWVYTRHSIEGTSVAASAFKIPTQEILLDVTQLDLKPWEIHAVASLLTQIGKTGLRKFGLHVNNNLFANLEKARKNSESAKGQLRDPKAVEQIFTKLVLIAKKGSMAPFLTRSAQLETLIDIFEEVPVDTLRKILANELQVSFSGGAKS